MITAVTFDTAIGGDYKRNNRSTRQKSLRCFPSCGIKGHVTGGFCGLPLKVTIEISRESNVPEFVPEDYRFIAEIRPVSQPRISGAKHILEADLLRQIRSKYEKNEANGELFQADNINVVSSSSNGTEMELTFNSQHCSWDYSWKSNRWSGPQEQHVVDIIVLKSISAVDTRVVSFASSTPFVVSSSHKKPVKTNQIKDEEDEELICLPAAKGRRTNVRSLVRPEEEVSLLSTLNTSTLTLNSNTDIRGGFAKPFRHPTLSEDRKFVEFTSEEEPTDQETLREGALALIQLAVPAHAPAPAPAPAMAPVPTPQTQNVARKDKKAAQSCGEVAHKRVKTEDAAPDMHHPYGYYPHYQYPGYPPPYPYPYPSYSFHPPSGEDAGGEGSSVGGPLYSEHDYAPHMHSMYPGPASHPPFMYHPPFAYGPPPSQPPQGSKHAMQPYGMPPPYGLGPYPPLHPMLYPPHLPYPGPYRPAPTSSSSSTAGTSKAAATHGESSDGETASDGEDNVALVARCLTGSVKSARAPPAARDDTEAAEASELPVAVPVPLSESAVVATAFGGTREGEHKALKFPKHTQRFSTAGMGTGPIVAWDGRIAEAPAAVRSIAPLERARTGSSGSGGAASAKNVPGVVRAVNSGSVTP